MYYLRIISSCFFLLIILGCNQQDKTSLDTKPVSNPVENKSQVGSASIELHSKDVIKPHMVKPKLDLSIDSVINENNYNSHTDRLSIDNEIFKEKNSALFNTLNKKNVDESDLNLSSEFLTDKSVDNTKNYLKSVDGIKLDIKGNFK